MKRSKIDQIKAAEETRKSLERRIQIVKVPALVREGDNGAKYVEGFAAKYYDPNDPGTEYELWPGIKERILPGAFDKSIANGWGNDRDVVCLRNHDDNLLLGRTSSGTLTISSRNNGLFYSVLIDDTTHGLDTHKMAIRGDIKGSSFGFYPVSTEYVDLPNGDVIINRKEVELIDVSPVTNPAYLSSEAWARSFNAVERELHRENILIRMESIKRNIAIRERELKLLAQRQIVNSDS